MAHLMLSMLLLVPAALLILAEDCPTGPPPSGMPGGGDHPHPSGPPPSGPPPTGCPPHGGHPPEGRRKRDVLGLLRFKRGNGEGRPELTEEQRKAFEALPECPTDMPFVHPTGAHPTGLPPCRPPRPSGSPPPPPQ